MAHPGPGRGRLRAVRADVTVQPDLQRAQRARTRTRNRTRATPSGTAALLPSAQAPDEFWPYIDQADFEQLAEVPGSAAAALAPHGRTLLAAAEAYLAGSSTSSSSGSTGHSVPADLSVQPHISLCTAPGTAAGLRILWTGFYAGLTDMADPGMKMASKLWPTAGRWAGYVLAAGLGGSVVLVTGVLPHVLLQHIHTIHLAWPMALACSFTMAGALSKAVGAGLAVGWSPLRAAAVPLVGLTAANILGWCLVPVHGLAALTPLLAWTVAIQMACKGVSNAAASAKLPGPATVSMAEYQVCSFPTSRLKRGRQGMSYWSHWLLLSACSSRVILCIGSHSRQLQGYQYIVCVLALQATKARQLKAEEQRNTAISEV